MNIVYKTDNIELSPDVRAYTEEKLAAVQKLLGNYDPANVSCDIILGKNDKHQHGDIYRADLTIIAGGSKTHAVGHGESLTAALDEAKDELVRRVRDDKEKEATLLRRGGAMLKNLMRWG